MSTAGVCATPQTVPAVVFHQPAGGQLLLPTVGRRYPNNLRAQGDSNGARPVFFEAKMRKEYDFSGAKRNPYAKRLKKQITIRIEEPTIEYFKELAEEMDLPYQTLINLYLRDCAESHRKLSLKW
jgi:uncharacterized protein (DUF4415 family)